MYYIMSNYSETIIYKIVCKDESITDCYVGHTTNFSQRCKEHRDTCNTPTKTKHHLKVYKFIRLNGGWDNWEMVEIEICNCENVYEAREIERGWIECLGATLNCIIPNRTDKEYYQQHKERINEKNRQYVLQHAEKISNYQKEYALKNREQILKQRKAFREANKERLAKYKKEWYKRKKLEKQQEQEGK